MKKTKKQVKPAKKVAPKSKKAVVLKKKAAVKSKAAKKLKAKPVKAVKAKAAVKKAPAGQATILGSVLSAIKKSKNGVAIGKIKEKTGLEQRQLSNALYKLSRNGKIKTKERGIYIAK
jgi:predicted Rossmann fold nucleotide-binding protein DprA/Smf involved in DNA uptake